MKKFNIKKFILFVFILVIIASTIIAGGYFYLISAPCKECNETITFYIEEGSSYNSIYGVLKEKNLIRNTLSYRVYLKLNPASDSLEYGEYNIVNNKSVKELISELSKGSSTLANTVSVKFTEGKNMRYVVSKIHENFGIDEEEMYSLLKNEDFLDELISKYWFLTDDIKNEKIYYSLEGYLYPDTYEFYENATFKDIVTKMLDNMENKLEPYRESVEKSKYSIHEIITLASIIELEAGNADRESVSGVFYNRLKANMSLGSDVTGYYGAKMDDWSNGLGDHANDCNDYNTRGNCVKGLPVGAICNPSVLSISAALNPKEHKYYYFVADCKGKTHLTKNYNDHINMINKLKREGNWCDN